MKGLGRTAPAAALVLLCAGAQAVPAQSVTPRAPQRGDRSRASAPAATGVYYEQTTVVSKNGRVLGRGQTARVWFAGRRMRIESGDPLTAMPLILRLDENRAFRLDPQRKQAVELDVEALRARAQMEMSTVGELLGGGDDARVRTTELPERRVVAGHACRGFRVKSPAAVLELCVAEGLPVTVEAFADYLEWTGATQGLGAVLDEIRKLPGLPLETRARVTLLGEVHETLASVTELKVGAQAPALFEPPPDYTVVSETGGEEP